MHFGVASNTSLVMALLTIHDSILGKALLPGNAARRAAALEVTASLRCLEGEFKISNQTSN